MLTPLNQQLGYAKGGDTSPRQAEVDAGAPFLSMSQPPQSAQQANYTRVFRSFSPESSTPTPADVAAVGHPAPGLAAPGAQMAALMAAPPPAAPAPAPQAPVASTAQAPASMPAAQAPPMPSGAQKTPLSADGFAEYLQQLRAMGVRSPLATQQDVGQQLAAQGRGPDSTLVHMAPSEVAGLNALAQSHLGRPLTINPTTGLPEAGILSSILPMVLGAVLSPFITPIGAAAVVGAGAGLMEHSLTKGLMAGLSAFGGAGIGGALSGMMGIGGSAAAGLGSAAADAGAIGGGAASGIAGDISATMAPAAEGIAGAGAGAGASASDLALNSIAQGAASTVPEAGAWTPALEAAYPGMGATSGVVGAAAPAAVAPAAVAPAATQGASTGLKGLMSNAYGKFGTALQQGATRAIPGMSSPLGIPGLGALGVPQWASSAAGAAGVMNTLSDAMKPNALKTPTTEDKYPYMGPYKAVPRTLNTPPASRFNDQGIPTDSSEFNWFSSSQPDLPYAYETQSGGAPPGYPGYTPPTPAELKARGYAQGGIVSLKPGGFVMDARSVSELGNGSSSAGKELLRKHGGEPIDGGKGDGVSDDIPARIKGSKNDQEARVARDEVKFSPKAVRKMGGPQKLYALVDAAHRARASAGRGQDTGLRRALA